MAERRMFAKTIIDSDAFLDMPLSTQALYFHLSMRADDDGFVNNPKKIQRMIGASDDDCKILVSKRFILTFESGVIVVKHWRIHNYIQKDRYKPSIYTEERDTLFIDDKGGYTEKDTGKKLCIPTEKRVDTKCIQTVSKVETQDRLGYSKVSYSPPIIPPIGEEGQVNEDKKRFIAEVAGRSQGKYDDSKVDYSLLLKVEKYCKRLATTYSMKLIISSYEDIIAGKWQTEDELRTEYADKNSERERVLATRRNRAETIADDNVRKVMSDNDYKKIHQQICTAERELAKSPTYDPEREEWLKKLKNKRDERLSFLGYSYADLFPKYECEKCNDTGYTANGKKCDCI